MTFPTLVREPASYSAFTLDQVRRRFDIEIVSGKLFADAASVIPSPALRDALDQVSAWFLVSEKARSEFIVAPILLELRRVLGDTISVLSGVRLDVAPDEGLQGVCDFIISRTAPVPIVQAPLVFIVEAKKGDLDEGLGQCAAEMEGARRFNAAEGREGQVVYGCVTSGEAWQFLRLDDKTLTIDPEKIYIEHVDRILGVLVKMLSA